MKKMGKSFLSVLGIVAMMTTAGACADGSTETCGSSGHPCEKQEKSPEEVCERWIDEMCAALSTCCTGQGSFDEADCRKGLSEECYGAIDVEKVHTGELVFDGNAAAQCLGTASTCQEAFVSFEDMSFPIRRACNNMLSGFRPLGAACENSNECARAGEMTYCRKSGGADFGVCAQVVVSDSICSFALETNVMQICEDSKYCDRPELWPPPGTPMSPQPLEYSASCTERGGEGVVCGYPGPPCAQGLYCEMMGSIETGVCARRKNEGESCSYFSSGECATGLFCDADPIDSLIGACKKLAPFCSVPQ